MTIVCDLGRELARPGGDLRPLALYPEGPRPLEPEHIPQSWADPLASPWAIFEAQLGPSRFLAVGFSLRRLDGNIPEHGHFASFGESLALWETRVLGRASPAREFAHLGDAVGRRSSPRGLGCAFSEPANEQEPFHVRWGYARSLDCFEPREAELKVAIGLEAAALSFGGEGWIATPWGACEAPTQKAAWDGAMAAREGLALRESANPSLGRASARL